MLQYVVEAQANDEDDEDDTPDGGELQTPPRAQSGVEEDPSRNNSTEGSVEPGADRNVRQVSATNIVGEHQVVNGRTARKYYAYLILIGINSFVGILVPETQESQSLAGTQHGWTCK